MRTGRGVVTRVNLVKYANGAALAKVLGKSGVSEILDALEGRDDLSFTELQYKVMMGRQASPAVVAAVEAGLIRNIAPQDARTHQYQLTPKGLKALEALRQLDAIQWDPDGLAEQEVGADKA